MRDEFLPFNRPFVGEEEAQAIRDVISSGWLTTGPKTKLFESEFSKLVKSEAALALNSCTAGLFLGLKAYGVGPGDEVITTPLTFCATANVIEHLGAITVLADIDPNTLMIDPVEIEKKITPKTKVILPVHFAGQIADMKSINAIAQKRNLKVLEDCAHCLPSIYADGTPVGGGPNLCAFSFYANKNITTGEGGMLTGAEEWVERCRSLSLHGMDRDAWKRFDKAGFWKYDVPEPGYKYNMTDIMAAMGLVQLGKLHDAYEKRKHLAKRYLEKLSNLESLRMIQWQEDSSFHIFPIVVNSSKSPLGRDKLVQKLKDMNIGTSVHYLPIHSFSYYREKYSWSREDLPNGSEVGDNCITLPLYPTLSESDQDDVINALQTLVGN